MDGRSSPLGDLLRYPAQVNLNERATDNTKMNFSVRSLLFATFLVAWVLAVNTGLSQPYGWLTAIPLVYSAPLLLLNYRTILGGLAGLGGALLFGAIGEIVNGWPHNRLEHWLAMVVFVAYGFACGTAVHSILLKTYILGTIVFLASAATLAYNLTY